MSRSQGRLAFSAGLILLAFGCSDRAGSAARADGGADSASDGTGGGTSAAGGAAGDGGTAAGGGARGGASPGGSTGTPDAATDECALLEAACAIVDRGSGPEHDCREIGTAGDPAACRAELPGCEAACGERLCTRLGGLCHKVDTGSGPAHQCHTLGHAGVAASCFARGAECNAQCIAAASDAGPADPRDAGADAPDGAPADGGPRPIFEGGAPEAGASTCEYLGQACGEVDPGSGPVHDCALLAQATDAGACAARLAECRTLCGASLCVRLGNVCHEVDPGSGPLNECHELGHAGAAGPCFDDAVECLTACRAAI